jgi:triosephosphate isomerase (TIM)
MGRNRLLIANWKMYKTSDEAAMFCSELATLLKKGLEKGDLSDCPHYGITPSYPLIGLVRNLATSKHLGCAIGAQNIATETEGAFTGEVSGAQLMDAGAEYVLIGHSERRELFGETDAVINAKIKRAIGDGLYVIACVGEPLAKRQAGEADNWVKAQVKAALDGLSDSDLAKIEFAYEPIWAIGTGEVCEAAEAARMCAAIRDWSDVADMGVLYGGSVKPENMASLMALDDIDGALVGGASLNAESFYQLMAHMAAAEATRNTGLPAGLGI